VVELIAAIGLFNYFNRFNDLLQMEPTQPASAEELASVGGAGALNLPAQGGPSPLPGRKSFRFYEIRTIQSRKNSC